MKSTIMKENKKKIELADQRLNVYGFLARIFREEITPEFLPKLRDPQILGVLSTFGSDLGDDFVQGNENDLVEDMAVEYTRLFLGPGKHIPPNESIFHEREDGDWGRFWGASTVEVKKFIETAGLTYRDDFTDMPDHISVEFEFMQKIIVKEKDEWNEVNRDGALYCLKMEKMFIDDHLIQWVPRFCNEVIYDAELAFYSEMAKITRSFIEFEKENIDDYIFEASG
jgi:TorA maturation chaperone TorD